MAYRSRILETANQELEGIVAYLSSYSSLAATCFLDSFEEKLDLLCSGVVSFGLSRMPELAALEYHCALVDKYLFLYYIENDELVVAHIFHQRQDYASLVTALTHTSNTTGGSGDKLSYPTS